MPHEPAVPYTAVMEAAFEECKRWLCADSVRIMNAGENHLAWFYEIRDSNKVVLATGKDFATHNAAMAAGRKKARELKASGLLPGS